MEDRSKKPGPEALEVLKSARLLVLDVDGVLTDGRIVYGDAGETQQFDVQDGAGLVWVMREGLRVAWITGRGCAATKRRAEELGIDRLVCTRASKGPLLAELQEEWGITAAETVAMGDDLPDLALAERAGFFATPKNGRPELRECAQLITEMRGGRGAVRELCELILRARGCWTTIVDAARR